MLRKPSQGGAPHRVLLLVAACVRACSCVLAWPAASSSAQGMRAVA
jgi:hypothetical protein